MTAEGSCADIRRLRLLVLATMAMSVCSMVLSITTCVSYRRHALANSRSSAVYDRIVAELADTLRPTYEQLGLKVGSSPPSTVSEALRPIQSLLEPIK